MAENRVKQLLGFDIQQLTDLAKSYGEAGYRGRQLFEAIYRQGRSTLDEISTLPAEFRQRLAADFQIGMPGIHRQFESVDGTIRYLITLGDGELVETVWMPEGDGAEDNAQEDSEEPSTVPNEMVVSTESPSAMSQPKYQRATICVSSQIGCAVNCQFCLTALLGIRRNLSAGEIVGQILAVLMDRQTGLTGTRNESVTTPAGESRAGGGPRINLVFMGMGEPFLNYENFMQAVRLLVEGVGIGESRMTVSTAGIVPRIRDLGQEAVRPKLAISLNASNDELRNRIMPINRKWNLEALLGAARQFPLRPRERLTFEYVLLDQVNEAEQNARELVGLVAGLRAKVNLIALNPGPGIPFGTPSPERTLRFQEVLVRAGVPTFIRRPRGRDIYAACGQLKKTMGRAGDPVIA